MIDTILQGNTLEVLKTLPDESVDCIITSPPYYGLRDYGVEGQIGLETNLNEYLDNLLLITAELKRVLKKTGTMWWNHGDNYGNSHGMGMQGKNGGRKDRRFTPHSLKKTIDVPDKSLTLQAYRLVSRMIDEQGWILRNQIIWHKPNVMPSSAKDRFTVDFEPVFFFSKSKKYWFEKQLEPIVSSSVKDKRRGKVDYNGKWAIQTINKRKSFAYIDIGGKNKRTVWKIATRPFKDAHFATFPESLVEIPIKAGCPENGVVLDPFMGAGTTAVVAKKLGRHYLGIELNPEYIKIAEERIRNNCQPTLL